MAWSLRPHSLRRPFSASQVPQAFSCMKCSRKYRNFSSCGEPAFPCAPLLIYNFFVSSTILIGSIGGYFLLEQFRAFEVPLLGLAAGSYLIVVFHDLVPHSIDSARERGHYGRHVVFFAAGVALKALFVTFLPQAERTTVED